MFHPEQLKRIALAKRQEKEQAALAEKDLAAKVEFTEEEVISYSKDLEGHVVAFAEDGNLFVDYQFKDNHSRALIHAVAQFFKQQHPLLMLIISDGEKKITVTWDGKNHV
jgi:hypothetical protein